MKTILPGALAAPNPSTVILGTSKRGITIGSTSVDIIRHISPKIFLKPPSGDRLRSICSTIVSEHSFYPLCPPDESVLIQQDQSSRLGFPGFTPDIIFLPSVFKTFAYKIPVPGGDCLVVNPGHLIKGNDVGTFAKIGVKRTKSGLLFNVDTFHI